MRKRTSRWLRQEQSLHAGSEGSGVLQGEQLGQVQERLLPAEPRQCRHQKARIPASLQRPHARRHQRRGRRLALWGKVESYVQ